MDTKYTLEKISFRRLLADAKQNADHFISSSAGIEIGLLFGILLAVEHFTGLGAFDEVTPHPYWAVVLLLSVRHGTGAGLASALIAIALYWAHGVPIRIAEEDYYAYSLRIWREPMLWLVVALVIGEIRLSQIEDRKTIAMALREAEHQRAVIAGHWTTLAQHVEDLERTIAVETRTSVEEVLTSLAAVRSTQSELSATFRRATVTLLGSEARTAVWRLDEHGRLSLDEALSVNPDTETWPAAPMHLLVGLAQANGKPRILSQAKKAHQVRLKGVGLLASPVRSADTQRIHGVLAVQHMERDRLLRTGTVALSLLVAELSQALDKHAARQRMAAGDQRERRAS